MVVLTRPLPVATFPNARVVLLYKAAAAYVARLFPLARQVCFF